MYNDSDILEYTATTADTNVNNEFDEFFTGMDAGSFVGECGNGKTVVKKTVVTAKKKPNSDKIDVVKETTEDVKSDFAGVQALKKFSMDKTAWIKIGAVALGIGLVAYGVHVAIKKSK